LTTPEVEHLLKITGLRVYIDEIRERGLVIIPDMFTWAKDTNLDEINYGEPSVWQLMMQEMDMYLWHLREIGARNHG
jgi:hypothetical protein